MTAASYSSSAFSRLHKREPENSEENNAHTDERTVVANLSPLLLTPIASGAHNENDLWLLPAPLAALCRY